jgi:hypothetical protein
MKRSSAKKRRTGPGTNTAPHPPPEDRVWSREIRRNEQIGERCLRQWLANGKFPPPDGNLLGRNFWLRSTYERWKADVLAGRYSRRRCVPPERQPRA